MTAQNLNMLVIADRLLEVIGESYAIGAEQAEKLPSLRALHAWWTAMAITIQDQGGDKATQQWEEAEDGYYLAIFGAKLLEVDLREDQITLSFLKAPQWWGDYRRRVDFQVRISQNGAVFFGWPVLPTSSKEHIAFLWKLDSEVFGGRIRENLRVALENQSNPAWVNSGTARQLLAQIAA